MFFEEIKLSKKSWHYKLQELTFGSKMPNYFSFCPYFWLTILCMLFSPITLTVHLFILPFKLLDKYVFQPNIEKWLNNIDAEYDYRILDSYWLTDTVKKEMPFSFNKKSHNELLDYIYKKYDLKQSDPDFYEKRLNLFNELRVKFDKIKQERYLKEEQLEEKSRLIKQKREEKRKAFEYKVNKALSYVFLPFKFIFSPITYVYKNIFLNGKINVAKMVKVSKVILQTLLIGFGLYLAYYLFTSINITSWNYKSFYLGFIYCFKYLGLFFIYVGILFYIIYRLYELLAKTFNYLIENSLIFQKITDSILSFLNIFVILGKLIISPFKIFIIFIKTFKEDNCPAIIWEDENK